MPKVARLVTQLAPVALSVAVTALAITVVPRGSASGPTPQEREAQPVMRTVTADRIDAVIGQKYRLRFSPDSGGSRVDESTAQFDGGGRLDVVLFGGLPRSVHAMACEVTQMDQQGAADLLGDCARVVAGEGGASAVASWIQASLRTPANADSASSIVGTTRYALRAVPATGAWVLSMSATASEGPAAGYQSR